MPRTDHKRKVEIVREAINSLYSDTSVGPDRTRTDLQSLKEEIDMLLDTLKEKAR